MMINSMKRTLLGTALAGAMGLMAVQANAASVTSVVTSGLNEFQDTDAERVFRGGQVITSGNVQVGDVFQAVLYFTDLSNSSFTNQIAFLPGLAPPYQLKAYSEIRIKSLTNCVGLTCDITFEANTVDGFGAMFSIYESANPADVLNLANSAATSVTQSQAGALVFSAGLESGEDDFWTVNDSLIDLGIVSGLAAGSPQAPNGNFGLSVIGPSLINIGAEQLSATNTVTGANGLYDIVGNSSVYGRSPGVNTDWLVSTNTLIQFQAVPEPSSLALVGLALAGIGAVSRRKRA